MDREQFFRELCTVLGREGFTTQPEQDDLLPVEWDSRPLCRITEGGWVRYWQEDVATSERNQACERATNLACMVQEYMTLMEQAPPLKAQGLSGDFRVLADFNGTVLAGHPTQYSVHFVTWDWNFDRTGLNYGRYFQENYSGAKQDFATRSGLISKQQIFNEVAKAISIDDKNIFITDLASHDFVTDEAFYLIISALLLDKYAVSICKRMARRAVPACRGKRHRSQLFRRRKDDSI